MELRLQLINPSTSPNELNTTLTPHSIIHGDACFAYFNKIWGIPRNGALPRLRKWRVVNLAVRIKALLNGSPRALRKRGLCLPSRGHAELGKARGVCLYR